jgi:hypothetical protein
VSRARYTSPMPPAPMAASISKVPKRVPGLSVVLAAVRGLYGESRLSFVSSRLGLQGGEPGSDSLPLMDLSLARIERAARSIDPMLLRSPQYGGPASRPCAGRHVVADVEAADPLRSLRGRGGDFMSGVAGGRTAQCASSTAACTLMFAA